MAITDQLLTFCRAESLAGTGDAFSTDYVPLNALRDIGEGSPLWVRFHIDEAFAGGTQLVLGVAVAWSAGPVPLVWAAADTLITVGTTEDLQQEVTAMGTYGILGGYESPLRQGMNYHVAISMDARRPPTKLGTIVPGTPVVPGYGLLGAFWQRTGTFTAGKITASIVDNIDSGLHIYPAGAVT